MIPKPTVGQLIRTVRTELLNTVAPAVDDPQLAMVIEMMASILYSAAQRSDNELRWMRESAVEIDAVASDVLAEHGDRTPGLREARRRFVEGSADADGDSPRADYDRAGTMLAALLAESLNLPADVRQRADSLLRQRLMIEGQILGDFKVVGR